MLRSRFEISRNWTILLCSSVTKRRRKSIFMPRIYDASSSRRNSYQRVDPKQCTIWTSLGHNSLQQTRKIQYWSSGSIFASRSNRILDSNCEWYWQICQRSHADPRGRVSFGETRCKSETNIKTVINKRCDETQESNDPCCFQVSKFITRLLRHSQKGSSRRWWKSPLWPSYWWMQDKDFVNAPHWSIENWVSDVGNGKNWGQ